MKNIQSFLAFIFKTHLQVAIAAILLAFQTLLLTGEFSFLNPVLLFIFCGTAFIYNLPYFLVGIPLTSNQLFEKIKNRKIAFVLVVISSMVLIIYIAALDQKEKLMMLLISSLAFLYVMPFSASGKRLHGLRNIPVLKNIVLAFVWTLATAVFPLMTKEKMIPDADLFFIAAKRFFFIFSLTIAFDIRDQLKDKKNNLKTIPNLIGIKGSKILAVLSLLFFVALIVMHRQEMKQALSSLPDFSFPLILSAIMTIFFILLINSKRRESFYALLMDGSMIFQFMLVYLFAFLK